MCFGNYCTNDMNIYLAPKRSTETNILKNSCFHNERRFWPFFPCMIECAKPQGTLYKCVQAILTSTLENNRAFFLGPMSLLKTQIFEKKANFPVKKRFWPIFSRNIPHDKCRGTFYKGPQVVLTISCANDMNIYLAPKRSTETNISKYRCFHIERYFWRIFSCIIGCDKPQ